MVSCQVQNGISSSPISTPDEFLTNNTAIPKPTHEICETFPLESMLTSMPKIPESNRPGGGAGASMIYDKNRQVIVLFGGTYNSDTWEYDGQVWKQVKTETLPPERTRPAMAYDLKRKSIIMYGGSNSEDPILDDVWEFDGKDWRLIELKNAPKEIRFPTLLYYPPLSKVILFGEYRSDTATYQTWTYDGKSWENLNKDLPAIPTPSMLYQTVLNTYTNKIYLQMTTNWTYEFDGNIWQVILKSKEPFMPIPVANLVYDTRRNAVVLFGLPLPRAWNSETWEFDGTAWKRVEPVISPPARDGHMMAYDEQRGVTVLFGGYTEDGIYLNDTWEYDGKTWVQR